MQSNGQYQLLSAFIIIGRHGGQHIYYVNIFVGLARLLPNIRSRKTVGENFKKTKPKMLDKACIELERKVVYL